MKIDSASAYLHLRRYTPLPLYAPIHILDDPPFPSIPSVAYVLNGWPISQPKDKSEHSNIVFPEIYTFEKKFFTKK